MELNNSLSKFYISGDKCGKQGNSIAVKINMLVVIGPRSTWDQYLAGDGFGEHKNKSDTPALYNIRTEWLLNNLTESLSEWTKKHFLMPMLNWQISSGVTFGGATLQSLNFRSF